ncbi:MAG TPA: type II toxin-antitoxin system RelE/ParE family toxin [Candidatus Baltobacteraceae bacterium]|nr:type II toxin-antitoxin system RelE/ParE family toxin [Candidatus Baltobacteraceae bacterium]
MRSIAWARGAARAFGTLPSTVQDAMIDALALAQRGGMSDTARPMHGNLREVVEIRIGHTSGTYRSMYTARFEEYVYVLHVFQKKAKTGTETPKRELDLIRQRLKAVKADAATRAKR